MKRFPLLIPIIRASHFPQTVAMVSLTTVSAAIFGTSGWALVIVALAMLSGQLSIGWSNDYIDAQLDRNIDRRNKPVVAQGLDPAQLRLPIVVALVIVTPLSFLAAGLVGGMAHLVAVASAWVYNLYLARTVWSWLPYAVSFALLPVFIAQTASVETWPTIPIVVLFSLVGVVAHILNAIPDIAIDREAGVGGLAVSLGRKASIAVAIVLGLTTVLVAALVLIEWLR
jgi:4-hydroxybenzoate polyprenyltransferase